MKNIDRIFGGLLVLSSLLHCVGTILLTPFMSGLFVWSMGSGLAGVLLGVLNIVRAARPADKTLAVITLAGTACWVVLALAFGKSIGNVFDPRVVTHVLVSAALVYFSGVQLNRASNASNPSQQSSPVHTNL